MRIAHKNAPFCLVLALLCQGTGCMAEQAVDEMRDDPHKEESFSPLLPAAYTAKVKNLLLGEAPTDEEIRRVEADPQALSGLIDGWMERPQFEEKMRDFFMQAFQQTQVDIADYMDQLGTKPTFNPRVSQRFVKAAEESFARTAWALVAEGRPFTEVLTTNRYMLNTPLLVWLAYTDTVRIDDAGKLAEQPWIVRQDPMLRVVLQTQAPVPIEESLNPRSPNYMKWYLPPYMGMKEQCKFDTLTLRPAQSMQGLLEHLFGGRPQNCGSFDGVFVETDWDDWRMVTVRAPKAGEERGRFYDLPALRKAQELLIPTRRMGFMTTPAFFANWPTNPSNSARVTTNQAMIVALGKSFDDTNITVQVTETADGDDAHVMTGTVCYGCHRTLDPMRDFFRQSYTLTYHMQADPLETQKTGTFSLDGVVVSGKGIEDFGRAMAAHPRFAPAWVQKLCRYANSSSCTEDDPEFLRVARLFAESGFSFKTLVRELFSSPLVTAARETKTSKENGIIISILRREHLCAALAGRLGLPDACGLTGFLRGMGAATMLKRKARNLALSIPGAGYARGAEVPLLPHDPNLFFQSATENLCAMIADQVIDQGQMPRYRSSEVEGAIRDFVRTVMALPTSDARAAPIEKVLRDHFDAAIQRGTSKGDALKSTFVLACSSPLATASGL